MANSARCFVNQHGDHHQPHCCFLRYATETEYFIVGVFQNKDHELSTGRGSGGVTQSCA